MPVISTLQRKQAARLNPGQADRLGWSVISPPAGGRPQIFSGASDEALAEWVAVIQGVGNPSTDGPVDGILGPKTMALMQRFVSDALRDGSGERRESHIGWEIFDRISLPSVEAPRSGVPSASGSSLTGGAAREAAAWNGRNHAKHGWSVRGAPGGGRARRFSGPTDVALAHWIADIQLGHGNRDRHGPVDGKLGPRTTLLLSELATTAAGDVSPENRAAHIGWAIVDYLSGPWSQRSGGGGVIHRDPSERPIEVPVSEKSGLGFFGYAAIAAAAAALAAAMKAKRSKRSKR